MVIGHRFIAGTLIASLGRRNSRTALRDVEVYHKFRMMTI
jgi:hypothetical protein